MSVLIIKGDPSEYPHVLLKYTEETDMFSVWSGGSLVEERITNIKAGVIAWRNHVRVVCNRDIEKAQHAVARATKALQQAQVEEDR